MSNQVPDIILQWKRDHESNLPGNRDPNLELPDGWDWVRPHSGGVGMSNLLDEIERQGGSIEFDNYYYGRRHISQGWAINLARRILLDRKADDRKFLQDMERNRASEARKREIESRRNAERRKMDRSWEIQQEIEAEKAEVYFDNYKWSPDKSWDQNNGDCQEFAARKQIRMDDLMDRLIVMDNYRQSLRKYIETGTDHPGEVPGTEPEKPEQSTQTLQKVGTAIETLEARDDPVQENVIDLTGVPWEKRGAHLWPAVDGPGNLNVWIRGNGTGLVRVPSRVDLTGWVVDFGDIEVELHRRRRDFYVAELTREQIIEIRELVQ